MRCVAAGCIFVAATLVPTFGFGDLSCWLDIVDYKTCCNPTYGPQGNPHCWDDGFTFERCCAVDPCLHQLQAHQPNCRDAAPTAALIEDALAVIGKSELKKYILAVQISLEQKDQIGFDPMASTAFLAGERLKGLPGYGEPGFRARIYYELACQSSHLLAKNVIALCPELSGHVLDQQQTIRKVNLLHLARLLSGDIFHLAGYLFRVAIELVGWLHLSSGNCQKNRQQLSQAIASSLQSYWEQMGKALNQLSTPQVYAPGMGSTSNIIAERMTSPGLIDFWKKLVEGAMSAPCLDIVLNLVILVSYILNDAVRLRTHLFAQFYVTELQSEHLPATSRAVNVLAPQQPGQQFVFQTHRCCLRYHVLLQLLEELQLQKSQVTMIEIGVHTGSTAKFLLDRAPFLRWTGIDPYIDYRTGSGDGLFADAMKNLEPFGQRAQLLRMPSSEAWETEGPLRGVDVKSVDLLFVDGDHDYHATLNDLKSWSRFVRSGGIISGHDIFNPVNDGVTDAVEDLLRGKNTIVRFATDHVYWWYS